MMKIVSAEKSANKAAKKSRKQRRRAQHLENRGKADGMATKKIKRRRRNLAPRAKNGKTKEKRAHQARRQQSVTSRRTQRRIEIGRWKKRNGEAAAWREMAALAA
jgi:hypothetical protein